MKNKYVILTLVTFIVSSLTAPFTFINNTTSAVMAAAATKVYEQRTFQIEGKGNPDDIAKIQDRFPWSKYEPTGIYVKQNEEVTVNVKGGSSLFLYVQSYAGHGSSNSWDEKVFNLSQGENKIVSPKSGVLYLGNQDKSGTSEISINGGSHIPVFEKSHSDKDFSDMLNKYKDAPYVEYVSDHAIITISYERAKKYTNKPSKLLENLDISLEAQYAISAVSPKATDEKHKLDPHYAHMIEDHQQNMYMYATYYRTAYAYGGEAVEFIVDADKFTTDGWGPWHENGHTQQQQNWNFTGMTEVQVNLFSLVAQLKLGNKTSLETGDEYQRMLEYFKLPQDKKDYDQLKTPNGGDDFFLKLVMIWQLHLGLGENFYPNLHKAYREIPVSERLTDGEAKKQYFMYMASKISGQNLLPFFEMWGLKPSGQTRSNIESLKLPLLEAEIWKSTDSKPVKSHLTIDPDTDYDYIDNDICAGNHDTNGNDNADISNSDDICEQHKDSSTSNGNAPYDPKDKDSTDNDKTSNTNEAETNNNEAETNNNEAAETNNNDDNTSLANSGLAPYDPNTNETSSNGNNNDSDGNNSSLVNNGLTPYDPKTNEANGSIDKNDSDDDISEYNLLNSELNDIESTNEDDSNDSDPIYITEDIPYGVTNSLPKMGDNNFKFYGVIIITISGLALATLTVLKRKKRK